MGKPHPSPDTTPSLSALPAKGRILIVEDDLTSLNALRLILANRGYDVVPAATLAEALRLLDESFTAVILDLMLPDGDGIEILRQVRGSTMSTRVLVTTASSDISRLERVRALRPDKLLRKPIDLSELLRSLAPA
jgi:two-component system response regulator QseB